MTSGSFFASEMTAAQLQSRMLHTSKTEKAKKEKSKTGRYGGLKVRNLSVFSEMKNKPAVQQVSFSVRGRRDRRSGREAGQWRKELCEALCGLSRIVTGKVTIYDDDITADRVRGVRDLGVSFLLSTPQYSGVAASLSIQENLLPYQYTHPNYRNYGFLDQEKLEKEADRLIKEYDIRCQSGEENASGPVEFFNPEIAGGAGVFQRAGFVGCLSADLWNQ